MTGRLKLAGQVVAVAAVGALLVLLVWKVTHQGRSVAPAVDRGEKPQAPDWTFDRLDREGELSLASLRGKVVVLNLFAAWCYPCRKEAPHLQAAHRRWQKRGVVVVGVDSKDIDSDGRRFIRRYGLTYPIVRDGKGKLWRPYGVRALPETFFITRDGRIASRYLGRLDAEELDAGIRAALAA